MAIHRPSFELPGLGWVIFDTAQGWRIRFPDGREDWPTPRERQILLAFRQYVESEPALLDALRDVVKDCYSADNIRMLAAGYGVVSKEIHEHCDRHNAALDKAADAVNKVTARAEVSARRTAPPKAPASPKKGRGPLGRGR